MTYRYQPGGSYGSELLISSPNHPPHHQGHLDDYPQQPSSTRPSPYTSDYDEGDMPRSPYHVQDTDDNVNMAGFAARKFAQRKQQQEAQRRAEYEQRNYEQELNWRMAQEAYAIEKEQREQRRWAEQQQADRQQSLFPEEEREVRRQQDDFFYSQQQAEHQRAEERRQQRSRAMASSSSPLARSIPLPEKGTAALTQRRPTLRELRLHSKTGSTLSTGTSVSLRVDTNQSRTQHSTKASTSSSNIINFTNLQRETKSEEIVVEGGTTFQADGFGGMTIKTREPTPPPKLQDERGEDVLILAKCADCGQRFPLDKLDGHSCISLSDCKSPLFMRSTPTTPFDELPPQGVRSAQSRSPFLEKYAQVVEKSSSPLMYSAGLRAEMRPPLVRAATEEPISTKSNMAASPNPSDVMRVEELRRERLRHIQEQRAAAKNSAGRGEGLSLGARDRYQMSSPSLHNREPASISSSSASSRMSSLLDNAHDLNRTADITPSSSVESMHDEQRHLASMKLLAKGERRPARKAELDLGGIEDLLHDIHTDNALGPDDREESAATTNFNRTGLGIRTDATALTLAHRQNIVRPSAADLKRRLQESGRKPSKRCNACAKTFAAGQPMVEKDGKIFCIDDYAELYLEKCRKCNLPVRDVGVRSQDGALSGIYHRDCFSCFRCHSTFHDGTFYIYENAPYCSRHYHYLNGTTCHTCKEGIEGKCRQMETGERFHPRCLTCQYDNGKEFCKDTLTDYYLIKGKRLCEWHYDKVQKYMEKETDGAGGAYKSREAYKRRTIVRNVEARKGRA